jgi:outer membrane protein
LLSVGVPLVAQAADLKQVVELARQNDPQLRAAEDRLIAAREGTVQAKAGFYPTISAGYDTNSTKNTTDFTNQDGEKSSVSSTGGNRGVNAQLLQPLYRRSNYTQLASARANIARAEADFDLAFDEFLVRAAEAYFAVLTAEDNLAFASAENAAVKRQLDQAEQRFEVGLTAITDVHEARARFDASRARMIVAENTLDDNREALRELTNSDVPQVDSLRDNLPLQGPMPDNAERWVETALENSPGLASAQAAADVAQATIETQRAGHYPTLDASLNFNDSTRTGDNNPTAFFQADGSRSTTWAVSLNVPIFNGFAVSSRVREAAANHSAALEQLEQQRRATIRQTRNAYRGVIATMSEVEARQQALISAQSALEATQAGFDVGTRTIVDVLLAQQVLFQAQSDLSTARYNYILTGLRLKRAAGSITVADIDAVNALLK